MPNGRYSRVFKLIDIREYDRLFDQALQDHEAAVRLDPRTAENFFARGLTYYDRAWAAGQDNFGSSADERYWSLAAEDFTRAIELDGTREQAFDMRGMTREHLREYDGAVADYTKVLQLVERDRKHQSANAWSQCLQPPTILFQYTQRSLEPY